ncbi:major facilitator superfamily domain-containing protein [Coniochaeta sp. 2T2.1]|nr:major facilitator superfamily domain-containing protein [Coniochaeta sp. 2T2.1]
MALERELLYAGDEARGLLTSATDTPRQELHDTTSAGSSTDSFQPPAQRDERSSVNGRHGPGGGGGNKKPEPVGWMDLPNKDQLFVLAVCRLSEPLSNVCLLPYIFYLVRSVLAPKDSTQEGPSDSGIDSRLAAEVSAYSGLLVASFPLAQFFVSLPWGRLSDIHGRKFSIVIGLAVSVLANAAFGFSRSFGALLFWRTLAGLANGNIGIMRTMTAEIVKERKYQTKAFLLLPLVFNSGMVFSLALGGILAEPAVSLPWLFGPRGLLNWCNGEAGVQWVIDFPYALPALMNACMLSTALLLSVFWLRETLAGKEDDRDVGVLVGQVVVRWFKRVILRQQIATYMALKDAEEVLFEAVPVSGHRRSRSRIELEELKERFSESTSTISVSPSPPPPPPPAPKRLPFRSIFTWRTIAALVSFGLLPLHNSAFMHIFPVYLSTPHEPSSSYANILRFTGGLGLRSSTIGIWLGAFGICGILLQLFIYPRMQARLGTLGVFKVSLMLFPVVYLLAPYLSVLPEEGPWAWTRWPALGAIVWGQIMARTMAIPSTVILVTEAAPAKNVLGTVHGAGNMLASLARAVGPAVGGAVYAAGVTEGVVGAVWWFYLVAVAIMAAAWCWGVQSRVEVDEEGERR